VSIPSTLTVKSGCEDSHIRDKDCTGDAHWLAGAHGWEKRLCEPAARRMRKRIMAGSPCPKCFKPMNTHVDLIEVTR
jgi:hypothetical protein